MELISRALILSPAGVLCMRRRGTNRLFLPGGHVEEDESVPAALEREIWEELGVACRAEQLLGIVEHAFEGGDGYTREINFLFRADPAACAGPEPPACREAHLDALWVACREEELRARNLQPWILCTHIPAYGAGSRWPPYLSTFGRVPGGEH